MYELIYVPYCIIICRDYDWATFLLQELEGMDFPVPPTVGVHSFDICKHRIMALLEGTPPLLHEVLPMLPECLMAPLIVHQGPV
jgi:hypothetical protein